MLKSVKNELNTTVVEYVRGFDNKKRIIRDKFCVCALLARDNFVTKDLNISAGSHRLLYQTE